MSPTSNPLGLLLHCAAARATYFLRTLPPEAVARFADAHDAGLWRCMCRLLNIPGLSPHDPGETPRTRRGPLVEVGGRRQHFSPRRCSRGSLDFDWSHGFHSTGQRCQEEPGLQIGNRKILNQECMEGVGNTKLLLEWSSRFEKFTCSPFCQSPGVPR